MTALKGDISFSTQYVSAYNANVCFVQIMICWSSFRSFRRHPRVVSDAKLFVFSLTPVLKLTGLAAVWDKLTFWAQFKNYPMRPPKIGAVCTFCSGRWWFLHLCLHIFISAVPLPFQWYHYHFNGTITISIEPIPFQRFHYHLNGTIFISIVRLSFQWYHYDFNGNITISMVP
jgi:hypothetical protein